MELTRSYSHCRRAIDLAPYLSPLFLLLTELTRTGYIERMRSLLLPSEWRLRTGLSLAAMARALAIPGKNPTRTYQRYETGERQPPLRLIEQVRLMSRDAVTNTSWI